MANIKIHIDKLGLIKDSDIEVSPLMIFSGDSGLGKSYIAMLIHYFYAVLSNKSPRFTEFFKTIGFDYSERVKQFKNEGEAFRFKRTQLEEWLAVDSLKYLRYLLNNEQLDGKISVKLPDAVPRDIIFNYKEELAGLVNKDEVYLLLSGPNLSYRAGNKRDDNLTDDIESPFSFLLGAELVNLIFGDFRNLTGTYSLPPSRGPVMTEGVIGKSGLYKEFIRQKESLEAAKESTRSSSKDILNIIRHILEGDVLRDSNGEYSYVTDDSKRMPLSAAAASIRELAPLALIAQKENIRTISVLFEEPEAHLHPQKQRDAADIIGAFVNTGSSMQITTHSDYFLRRLNELILLNDLKKNSQEQFNKYCKAEGINPIVTLDRNKISAYYLEKKGDFVSIQKENLDNGIPFKSFKKAIEQNLYTPSKIEDFFDNDEECNGTN